VGLEVSAQWPCDWPSLPVQVLQTPACAQQGWGHVRSCGPRGVEGPLGEHKEPQNGGSDPGHGGRVPGPEGRSRGLPAISATRELDTIAQCLQAVSPQLPGDTFPLVGFLHFPLLGPPTPVKVTVEEKQPLGVGQGHWMPGEARSVLVTVIQGQASG
jgi:hypothetical protein